jgi:hypothetical protein
MWGMGEVEEDGAGVGVGGKGEVVEQIRRKSLINTV